jgi:hypothetical protein
LSLMSSVELISLAISSTEISFRNCPLIVFLIAPDYIIS